MSPRDPLAELAGITRPTLVGRCPVCGAYFRAERRSKVYCSAACLVRASEQRRKVSRPLPG